jgi:peptidoglycan/xylan/chitin deacetylase (PgdA/CDA1 family)
MWLALIPPVVGLLYFACYGGLGGPIERWLGNVRHAPRRRRCVALTFDDGPDPVRTPALLDALAAHGVKATFFVVGRAVDAHPELCRRIAAEGHQLGNHTYTHRYLPLARTRAVERELAETDRAIARAAGAAPTLARPPYGARTPWTIRAFRRRRQRVVMWDVNSFDWRGHSADRITARVLARARPGSIVLLHEARAGGETTVAAVRQLIPALRARGLEPVTVGEALAGAA